MEKTTKLNDLHALVCNARGKILEQIISLEMCIDLFLESSVGQPSDKYKKSSFSNKIKYLRRDISTKKIKIEFDMDLFVAKLRDINRIRDMLAHWRTDYDFESDFQNEFKLIKLDRSDEKILNTQKLHFVLVEMSKKMEMLHPNMQKI